MIPIVPPPYQPEAMADVRLQKFLESHLRRAVGEWDVPGANHLQDFKTVLLEVSNAADAKEVFGNRLTYTEVLLLRGRLKRELASGGDSEEEDEEKDCKFAQDGGKQRGIESAVSCLTQRQGF
jgi:hypothetical protein